MNEMYPLRTQDSTVLGEGIARIANTSQLLQPPTIAVTIGDEKENVSVIDNRNPSENNE